MVVMLHEVKSRYKLRDTLKRAALLQAVKVKACERELKKIDDLSYKAYRVTWSHMFDHHQVLTTYNERVKHMNWFWILTGRSWHLRYRAMRFLRLLALLRSKILAMSFLELVAWAAVAAALAINLVLMINLFMSLT